MKWNLLVLALLMRATPILGEIYIKEELIQDAPAFGMRDVDAAPRPTRTPAYSSCIISYGGDPDQVGLQARTEAAAKTTITVNPNEPSATPSAPGGPDAEHEASEFCSDFLQHPATAVATKTVVVTSVNTVTISTTAGITKTSTNVIPGTTVSAFCPIASTGMTCGLSGWGYATNNIYAGSSIDPPACQQLCLKNSACGSYQIVTNSSDPLYTPQCNLYNVTAGGNNTIAGSTSPYSFYDRDCQNFSPAGCGGKNTPELGVGDAVIKREPTPTFLLGIPSNFLSSVCACVISTTLRTAGATKTISSVAVKTSSITKTVLQTVYLTTTIGGAKTILSSVH